MERASDFFKRRVAARVVRFFVLSAVFSIALASGAYAVDWAKNDTSCTRTIPVSVTENPSGYYSSFAVLYKSVKDSSVCIIFGCNRTSDASSTQQQFSCNYVWGMQGATTFRYISPANISSSAGLSAYDACEFVYANAKISVVSNTAAQ